MTATYERLMEKVLEVHDILFAQQLLEWDQQVMMPPKGAEQRASQVATLAGLAHSRVTDPELNALLRDVEGEPAENVAVQADLRETRRFVDRALKLPARLVTERAQACARAQTAWQEARPKNDFAAFLPHLEKVLALTRETAAALGGPNRYDALLDEYEPGMTEAQLHGIFGELKMGLLPLLDALRGAPRRPDASVLQRTFPVDRQEAFCRRLVADIGFDLEAGRFDVSAHPFTSGTLGDVRLTTRYLPDYLPTAIYGSLHEGGHGIYEQGLDPVRFRHPAGGSCSLGIHESQSRFWENMVGRSRPFCAHYLAPLKQAFPGLLDDVDAETFYGAANSVAPSLIRVEADEATYNLHILLRFELESALLAGTLEAKDLPGAWNEKMEKYLGIVPPDHRSGVLQDVHWSVGLIGYFPTYTLGNLYAAQFRETLLAEMPDFEARIGKGDFLPIRDWLREKIHRHGRTYLAQELCQRVTGRALTAGPLIAYMRGKYSEIYGI